MTRISAPFRLDPIPSEHAFGGHVQVVADGMMIEFDETRVGSVHLNQSWYSDKEKIRLRSEFLEVLRSGKITGVTEADILRQEADPYVRLEMRRPENDEDAVSWFWNGDGTYDGYEADGADADEGDDDVLGDLEDDFEDEESEEDEDSEDEDSEEVFS